MKNENTQRATGIKLTYEQLKTLARWAETLPVEEIIRRFEALAPEGFGIVWDSVSIMRLLVKVQRNELILQVAQKDKKTREGFVPILIGLDELLIRGGIEESRFQLANEHQFQEPRMNAELHRN